MVTEQLSIRSGYKQTELGIIPNDWEINEIGDHIVLLTGFPFSSSHYSKNGIKLLRGSNIKRDEIDWSEDITRYWEEITPNIQKYFIKNEGDIVVAMDGSLVGQSFARLSKKDLPVLLLQRVAQIRSDTINMAYLKEWICSKYFTKYSDSVKTVTAIPHISPKDIKKFTIAIPPNNNEQIAIGESLSDIDKIIKKIEKIITKKKNIKQGTMQELLTGKRRLAGFEEEWKERTLKEIGVFTKGKGIKKTEVVDYGLQCIRYGEIYTKYDIFVEKTQSHIPLDVAKKSQQIKNGNILFTGSGETPEEIGKCIVYLGKNQCYAGGDTIIFSSHRDDPLFLVFLLNFDYIQKQKSCMAQGDMVVHIYSSSLKKLKFQIPDVPEQIAIAEILSEMNSEIKELDDKRKKYIMIKDGMMQKLLTGEIRLT